MRFKTAEVTLSAAVASGGTITFQYPANTSAGSFGNTSGHKLWVAGHQKLYASPADFTVSFGASDITVTYSGSTAIPAGTRVSAQFNQIGDFGFNEADSLADVNRTGAMKVVTVNLGSPITADADGVCASQAGTADTAMTIAGALASGGVATFDVPRNVVAAWTNTAVLTITGTDEYGNTVVEVSASGTSHTGKKAFKTVTSVVPSANITGATVGTGVLLGLPIALKSAGQVLKENQDGATATAGTLAAAATAVATGTTGDVRGTYSPNSAPNGTRRYSLLVAVDDIEKGVSQYTG